MPSRDRSIARGAGSRQGTPLFAPAGEAWYVSGMIRKIEPDIADAHVALVTRATRSLVWTGDPGDTEAYRVPSDFIRAL